MWALKLWLLSREKMNWPECRSRGSGCRSLIRLSAREDIRVDTVWVSGATTGMPTAFVAENRPAFGLVASNFAGVIFPQEVPQISWLSRRRHQWKSHQGWAHCQSTSQSAKGHFSRPLTLATCSRNFERPGKVLHDQVNLTIKHGTICTLLS